MPPDQVRDLRSAISDLEQNRPDRTLAALERLAPQPLHPFIGHTAALLHGQLTGAFQQRRKFYLNRSVMPVVVLVPDEAALLEALEGWNDQFFYPILIEDGWFTPIFVRSFQPRAVVRWAKTPSEQKPQTLRKALEQRIARHNRSFNTPTAPPPPGLVVIDPDDPQRMAGLALALGHGQPIHLLPNNQRVTTMTKPGQAEKMNADLFEALNKAGLLKPGQWCGLTLAGEYPLRYSSKQGEKTHRMAMDDRLGRTPNGLRMAVTGRLWGDAPQSVYMAMGSLFLNPHRALLFDDYPNRGGTFMSYRLDHAVATLSDRLTIQHISGKDASPLMLRKAARTGAPIDLLWMNTSGNARDMALRGKGFPSDLPCDRAYAFYLIHSYSAAAPWSKNTMAGWALSGGAYWMFGSVHEPYLHAFVMPTGMAHKIKAGTPIAFAARHLLGHPMSRPWKLAAFGDPLFALRTTPAARQPVQSIAYTQAIDEENTADALPIAFHDALLNHRDSALPLARQILQSANHAAPGDLARAVWLLYRDEQYQELAVIPPLRVKSSYLARWCVWKSGLILFNKSAEAGSEQAARLMLQRLLEQGLDQRPLQACMDRWMELAGGAKAKDQILAFIKRQSRKELPGASKKVLESTLKTLEAADSK